MGEVITALDLDAIKARAEKATQGPWIADESHVLRPDKPGSDWDGTVIATVPDDEFGLYEFRNVEFLAAARTDVPALVAEVERLRAIIADAKRELALPYPGQSWASSLNVRPNWARAADLARTVLRREPSGTSEEER